MTVIEKTEICSVIAFPIATFGFGDQFPANVHIGYLLLALSLVVLIQALIRDLWLMVPVRKKTATAAPVVSRCICVESVIGTSGVIAGLLLSGAGIREIIHMSPTIWSGLIFLTMGLTFLMKDLVIEMGPWRIRREKDHLNIVFAWRRPNQSDPEQVENA